MGWTPRTSNRGASEEQQPVPRRRRATPAAEPKPSTVARQRRARVAKAGGVAPELHARDEHVVESRPEPGVHGAGRPQVTLKLGQRWSQIITEIKRGDYTWKQFAEGLSAEELARGQLKASDGTFTGRPPSIVPREFHLACFRELKRRFDEQFQSHVLDIATEYVRLAQDKEIPAKDRAKMMQYAMERVFGGVPKEVLVKQDAPWEQVVTTIVAEDGDEAPQWRKDRYSTYEEDEGSDDRPDND